MQKFKKSLRLQSFLIATKKSGRSIGFVPTMGSLHEGHISLVQKSKSENDVTIVSIYINPSQFNDENDFINYPKSLENDISLLKGIKCDVLFLPNTKEMYKDGFSLIDVDLGNLNLILESKKRPGHFNGVVFIVHKLFKIIEPNKAYFGEKDFQQLLIIKKLAQSHFKKISVIGCPTVRDNGGLAMSSRNQKLTAKQLDFAKKTFNLLKNLKEIIKKNSVKESKIFVNDFFYQYEEITLDYFEIIEESNFSLVNSVIKNKMYRMMIAFKVGDVRLIDNLKLKI